MSREGEILRRADGFFNEIWAAATVLSETIELKPEMVERIVNFVNETTPTARRNDRGGWTNDYAAKALATMRR